MGQPNALDDDIVNARALVIDANEASRRTLANMLRHCGVRRIDQAERPDDARGMLALRTYDIVLCDHHFPGEALNGQELMDDLRQCGLLPLGTVVVMVSAENDYHHVAEAAEVALDAYLLKPHTEAALRVRLARARECKRLLHSVIELVRDQHYDSAARAADELVDARGPAWIQAARIAADLHLRLGDPQRALQRVEQVIATGALPWARLGLASEHASDSGAVLRPRRTLESLIGDEGGYTDAYDVMSRVLLQQGDMDGAIAALQRAVQLTPASVPRRVKLGLLCFFFGAAEQAQALLDAAVPDGLGSRRFDVQALVLQGTLQFDAGSARALGQTQQALARVRSVAPSSPRLRRFDAVLGILLALLNHLPTDAVTQLNQLLAEVLEPSFDYEAAVNLMLVLSRLDEHELHLSDLDHHVQRVAQRFAVSRITCDFLCAALRRQHGLIEQVRRVHEEISATVEQAAERSLAGEPLAAAQALLKAAEQTRNAKQLDVGLQIVQRHRERIGQAPADELQQRLQQLRSTYGGIATRVRVAREA